MSKGLGIRLFFAHRANDLQGRRQAALRVVFRQFEGAI